MSGRLSGRQVRDLDELGWRMLRGVPYRGRVDVDAHKPPQDPEEIVWQAGKIGYDSFGGRLDFATWVAAGQPVATVPRLDPDTVDPARVVDVRQFSEYQAGRLPTSRNVELGALADAELPAGPVVTMCGHGERATTAASERERAARIDGAVLPVGPEEWAKATGRTVEVSA